MLASTKHIDMTEAPASRFAGWSAYDVVRIVVASVLLVAAVLKGYQLSTEPVLAKSLFSSRWFLIGVVECEFALAVWLLSAYQAKMAWRVTLICFAGFAAVSLLKGFSGAVSCGCFGRVTVNPWVTLTLDLAVLAAMLRWRPRVEGTLETRRAGSSSWRMVVLITSTLGLLAIVPMGSFRAASLGGEGLIDGGGNVIILEPEAWLGKTFPLLPYIKGSSSLSDGEWDVLLFHHDCSRCQEVMPEYLRLADSRKEDAMAIRVALIEIPPSAGKLLSPNSSYLRACLDDSYAWFATTPVQIRLRHGIVVNVLNAANSANSRTISVTGLN